MRLLHFVALVFGSSLFLPVSCTTGVITGTCIISLLEARDMTKGNVPHSRAYLVAVLTDSPKDIKVLQLSQLEEFRDKNPKHSFLMPMPYGKITWGDGTVTFTAKPETASKQLIEVTLQDDTGTFFRYEATDKKITPLYTKLWYHGYMFAAVPYALAFAVALYLFGKLMRLLLPTPNPSAMPGREKTRTAGAQVSTPDNVKEETDKS